MLAREIMTSPVTTIGLKTPAREIAAVLAKANISGVPVVDAKGRLLGIVSEADLMRHLAHEGGPAAKWWLSSLAHPDGMARDFAKAHGRTAADLMTRHVASIRADATLSDIADAFVVHGVKRLPVLHGGTLVGIITRRDLIGAMAKVGTPGAATMGNATLQRALLERMAKEGWLDASYINVLVRDDAIELTGFVPSADQKRALEVLASEIDSKRRIVDKLEIGLPLVSDFA